MGTPIEFDSYAEYRDFLRLFAEPWEEQPRNKEGEWSKSGKGEHENNTRVHDVLFDLADSLDMANPTAQTRLMSLASRWSEETASEVEHQLEEFDRQLQAGKWLKAHDVIDDIKTAIEGDEGVIKSDKNRAVDFLEDCHQQLLKLRKESKK